MLSQIISRTKLAPACQTRAIQAARQQVRSIGRLPGGKGSPNVSGPGGQEVYPYSSQVHRRYATITAAGVLTAGAVMYNAKKGETGNMAGHEEVAKVLVYDPTKGELDNVKLLKPEDVKRATAIQKI
ncbi:hypothetical protein B0T19DRAFT_489074 [Cercophora scortea]|uniref:Uncharacterized protein n=1 Tax=Cercophora scortea TaxID=314031 RepID=A0AAE0M2Q2_9PEZI|nr:hypothetical protein B0T19DRAFT_489074 [Cercophora scortea]